MFGVVLEENPEKPFGKFENEVINDKSQLLF